MFDGIDLVQMGIVGAVAGLIGGLLNRLLSGSIQSSGIRTVASMLLLIPVLIPVSLVVGALRAGTPGNLLKRVAADVNGRAPVPMDPITTLNRATLTGDTLTYHYSLEVPLTEAARLKPTLEDFAQSATCHDDDLAPAVQGGAKIVFSYRHHSGGHLFDLAVDHCD